MASETTFSDIRCGYSISKSYNDAPLKNRGRDGFVTWFFNELQKWPHYPTLFADLGTSERLVESLCHTSFEHENSSLGFKSYERLEFLGDAVLDLMVSKVLLEQYPKLNEGRLSKLRGALVNENNLSKLARVLDLGNIILLGKGESQNGGDEKNAILADVIESTIAVFYLDKGVDAATAYFESLIKLYEEEFKVSFFDLSHLDDFDSKTKLQEKTMALYKEHPIYHSKETEGGQFQVSVSLKGIELARMIHNSKKKAEKILATNILNQKLYEEVQNAH